MPVFRSARPADKISRIQLDDIPLRLFDHAMRKAFCFVLALCFSLVSLGCEKNSAPAASPSSCHCGAQSKGRPEPAREEPADIAR